MEPQKATNVRFATRLTRVPTAAGRFRLAFAPIRNRPLERAIILTVVGPAPVLPPDREFTEGELHVWLMPYRLEDSGYRVSNGLEREGAALLEAVELEG